MSHPVGAIAIALSMSAQRAYFPLHTRIKSRQERMQHAPIKLVYSGQPVCFHQISSLSPCPSALLLIAQRMYLRRRCKVRDNGENGKEHAIVREKRKRQKRMKVFIVAVEKRSELMRNKAIPQSTGRYGHISSDLLQFSARVC